MYTYRQIKYISILFNIYTLYYDKLVIRLQRKKKRKEIETAERGETQQCHQKAQNNPEDCGLLIPTLLFDFFFFIKVCKGD